ncbi:MAG: preprotein translocase subunit SecA [Actinomycetota bacterium]
MGEGRILKKLHGIADQVGALEPGFEAMTDTELHAETDEFRRRLAEGETLDELLPEAFAAVREAARRTLGQRHFDVQVMGGAALHLGNIAEMKTGEGKTLVATLPAYLNALEGKGVHIVTVNDYLASYQSELMGRVFRFLGLTTGCILDGQRPDERRREYAADITYGTNNQFGFDYLRDNMAWSLDETVQRGHSFAIVDEVDSILIDEARTPLIISGPATGDVNRWYGEFARIALRLKADVDYEVDEKKRTIGVLEPGIEQVEDLLGIENLYESLNTPLISFLNNSIKAKELFKRDKDYIVRNGEVLIVDEHTGRVLPGRRYNEGMHQAIEAKEGVQIKAENQTLATITLQNYFRLYSKLSGMTGTAETEAAEFLNTYNIGVVPIPTNQPMIRKDNSDLVYKNVVGKFHAVVEDIADRHVTGQPVLVGTTSVEKSEFLSALLKKRGIPHDVLNAKQHEREASIVAMAGRKGQVTVATNMAGRGTDIMLGGNAEYIAVDNLRRRGLDPAETPEEYEAAWPAALHSAMEAVAAEHDEVVSFGGLYVLGTERHESRRIDNQLRGRSGRQGDPGESRFYLSMEDDLMRMFNSGAAARIMNSSAYPDDMPLESRLVSSSIASAQSQVEARNFEIRKNVLKYDDVLSRQREVVYATRRRILEGQDIEDMVQRFMDYVVAQFVAEYAAGNNPSEWDLHELFVELKNLYPVSITGDDIVEEAGGINRVKPEMLVREITSDLHLAYDQREEEVGEEVMRQLERRVVLAVLDRKWREHLYEMDYLKEGIGLRAMAQRDPVVEYRNEGYAMFTAMDESIKEESVRYLFNLQVRGPEEEAAQGSPAVTVAEAAGTSSAIAGKLAGLADVGAAQSGQAQAGQAQSRQAQSGQALPATPAAAPRSAQQPAETNSAATKPKTPALAFEPPPRPANLTYSASAKDGSSGRAVTGDGAAKGSGAAPGSGQGAAAAAAATGQNRAARRAAQKKQGKNR